MTRLRSLVVTLAATLVVACGASEPAAPVNEDAAVTPPQDTDAALDSIEKLNSRLEDVESRLTAIELFISSNK